MRNYRKYSQTYGRTTGGSRQPHGSRRPILVGVIIIALIVLVFAYERAGKRSTPPTNTNATTNVNVATTIVPVSAVTVTSCPTVVSSIATTQKIIALTYDVGTVAGDLAKTVPAAKAVAVPAAFFVTGKIIDTDKASVQLIHDAGFPMYNHSYDNLRFSTLTAKEVTAQLQATDDLIRGITGVTTKPYARIPFGDSTATSLAAMHDAGYCGLTWTVDGLDIETTATVDSVAQRVVKFAKPGAIILLHAGSDLAASATPRIVTLLQQQGYRFVTLDELFRSATPGAATNQNVNQSSNLNANTNSPA